VLDRVAAVQQQVLAHATPMSMRVPTAVQLEAMAQLLKAELHI